MKDPYEILGVPKSATDKEIKTAFKQIARKHHPDLHPDDKQSETIFKEASAAYDLLKDKEKRRRFDAGESIVINAAACKMYASEMVGRVADRAVQIFGGAGYMAAYPIERIYRDVRLFRIYEGTTQIQQLVIAREMRRQMG